MEQRRRRRSWRDAEKRRIVTEACAEGTRVAWVARWQGANANMVFKWLRDPQFCGEPAPAALLSVYVARPHRWIGPRLPTRLALEDRAGIIEIDLSCVGRPRIDAHVNDRALAQR